MSTDDLTAEARQWAADPASTERTSALVSELADEVDRLRGELARTEQQIHEDGGFIDRIVDLEDERDAARAALERVRGIVRGYYALPYEAHVVVKEIRTELEES